MVNARSPVSLPIILLMSAVLAFLPSTAFAQFDQPLVTFVRERIGGNFLPDSDGPTPEQGDQIGAFFEEDVIVGFFEFDEEDAEAREFSITLYGKLNASDPGNGPARGQRVTFAYFDSSTNQTISLRVLNSSGETVNFTFQGQEIPSIDIPGFNFGELLTPSRVFDLAPTTASGGDGGDGGGSGGGGGTPAGNPDVNADGNVDRRDAALVLRIVIGGPATSAERGRADVDGDGAVTTADAVEIYRAINSRPVPQAPSPPSAGSSSNQDEEGSG